MMADLFLSFLGVCELFAKFVSGSAKSIIDLRMFAIASNICGGVAYFLTGAWPQLTQSLLEIPIHSWRLYKSRHAMQEIERAENPDYAIQIIKKLAKPKTFAKDEVIFRKGDIANAAYILDQGCVRVIEYNVLLSAGALFGEMGLFLDEKRRTASATAAEDVVLHEIAYDTFEAIYAKNPEIGFAVMRLMSKRFSASAGAGVS
jgi:CRP/FNR family transcriptional regulator, cyclic AMP receptor protein